MSIKKTGLKLLLFVVTICIFISASSMSVFAQEAEEGVMPLATVKTLTYTLSPGQSKTTYKYSVPSSNFYVACAFTIKTAGGSIAGTLYGANSTSTANHEVASGSASYGDSAGGDGENLDISADNTYPMYCVKVTNTSSKTITVQLDIYSD